MRTWITSRSGITTLSVLIAIGAVLALLSAIVTQGLSIKSLAASLLILGFVVFTIGGVLFAGRAFLNWQIENADAYLTWERSLVIIGVLLNVVGLALLEEMLRAAGDSFLARAGMVTYFFGAVIVVSAETAYLGKRDWIYPQIVFYVIVAFVAQAAFGAALLQTGLVAGWVGWATILWNMTWLLIMLTVRPRDIYFPVLHHVAPLLIGIALLNTG